MPTLFQLARSEERRNRLLAYLSRAPRLCGMPAVPITARALLELELTGNACVCDGAPSKDAVFDFLWRLNPDFAAPLPGREKLLVLPATRSRLVKYYRRVTHGLRLRIAFGSARVAAAYLRVERRVAAKNFSVLNAFAEIKARKAQTYQDQAADTTTTHGLKSPLSPDRHWVEGFLAFYCLGPGSMRMDDVLDAPLARNFQLYREYQLARGNDAPFIAPSDALVGPPAGEDEA